MSSIRDASSRRRKRRLTTKVKQSLYDLNGQLDAMNHQVSGRLSLKAVDLECLGVIFRVGPVSPSALAARTAVHPATMTGILDRLQRGGWIVRARDPDATDRRAVAVRAVHDRAPELFALIAGMNGEIDRICGTYTEAELELITGFVHRVTDAARTATTELAHPAASE